MVYCVNFYCILYVWLFVTSEEVLPWQLGIIPQLAPTHEAETSRKPSESVYELDLDWFWLVLVISFVWNMYRHRVSRACFFYHCYTCIKTWEESGILSSTILEKLGVLLEFLKICCWIHFLAWINHSCIVIHKSLVLYGSQHYVKCVP